MRFIDTFIRSSNPNKHQSARAGRRKPLGRPAALRFETLEPRQMLSITPGANGRYRAHWNGRQPIAAPAADEYDAACPGHDQPGQARRPSGPTYLYLNFDGWKACKYNGNNDVTAFSGTAGDVASILYRTAEAYAPFNVIIQQISGNGNYATSAARPRYSSATTLAAAAISRQTTSWTTRTAAARPATSSTATPTSRLRQPGICRAMHLDRSRCPNRQRRGARGGAHIRLGPRPHRRQDRLVRHSDLPYNPTRPT